MSSYTNFEFKNTPPPSETANDIHIKFNMEVEVLGVDGVAPDAPNANYNLTGDGTTTYRY